MKTFYCDNCGSLLFFENTRCVRCGGFVAFQADAMDLATLTQGKDQLWRPVRGGTDSRAYRQCSNGTQHGLCNWLVASEDPNPLCEACRLNQIIPDLAMAGNLERWHKLEVAKRRVLYSLKDLGISPEGMAAKRNLPPLRFSFLADPANGPPVMTGHDNGLITINVAEADDPVREQRRVSLHEVYRTLLGHLRHEVAHYYWLLLIKDSQHLERFCRLFGNPSADYATALQEYYDKGPPPTWQERFVSAYASAHPAEDWAETFAHYLHILDTVETAASFGLSLHPKHPSAPAMSADLSRVQLRAKKFDEVLTAWFPLTYALNEMNRGMGLPDVYPFVLSNPALDKLRFCHDIVQRPGLDWQSQQAHSSFECRV